MGSRPESGLAALLVVVLVAMLTPNSAEAANVVNGNFESGTLRGWQVSQATGAGSWFAYAGTDAPIGQRRPTPADPVQPPPQGAFAAIADQANPDTLILYQDIALEAGLNHQLSLLAYYNSYKPIAIPSPDTLSVDEEALRLPNGKVQKNQQFRIDVIKPEAPLESLDPDDVLRPVFATKPATKPDDPLWMPPKKLTADLSAFAGQTVRIRIASAVTEEVLNAGVDAVSISTIGRGQSGSRGSRNGPRLFSFGRLRTNRHTGIATLRVRVSGPGLVRAKGATIEAGGGRLSKRGKLRKPIEPITVPVAFAKTVAIRLRPTPYARAILRQERRLRMKVAVTFRPLAGAAETATLPIVLRLGRRLPPRR